MERSEADGRAGALATQLFRKNHHKVAFHHRGIESTAGSQIGEKRYPDCHDRNRFLVAQAYLAAKCGADVAAIFNGPLDQVLDQPLEIVAPIRTIYKEPTTSQPKFCLVAGFRGRSVNLRRQARIFALCASNS